MDMVHILKLHIASSVWILYSLLVGLSREILGFSTVYLLFIQPMHAIRCAYIMFFIFGPQIICDEVPTTLYNYRSFSSFYLSAKQISRKIITAVKWFKKDSVKHVIGS
jgi:hypothetical protein